MSHALAYLRTSSACNTDGDSPHRQNDAIMRYAKAYGVTVVACYWDAAVRGTDPVETRVGFRAMLDQAKADDIHLILVEDETRFARDLIAQELGVVSLANRGIHVVTASGSVMTDSTDPTKVMMRQIAGAFSQYEKAKLVLKLRVARDRVRADQGRCEGRKSHLELHPEIVREAKRLSRRNPKTGKVRSLREISTELAALGYLSSAGRPFTAQSVKNMLAR
jgi:Site-specific recombinases, DNA invertase Pin homologs